MTYDALARWGVNIPEILLPRDDIDLLRWSVIACDQHTANTSYWKEVESVVKDSPSTLYLIHPEVYLDDLTRSKRIHTTMETYRKRNILKSIGHQLVLIERNIHGKIRTGLLMSIDLEKYDFSSDTDLPIRSSEKTSLERLKPRIAVRENAILELSHVLMLINDDKNCLFGTIEKFKRDIFFDTKLMLGGGHLTGYALDTSFLQHMNETLTKLEESDTPFFIVGDGNHNLAAAKQVWDKKKVAGASSTDPARWALVELVNVYDTALDFEPIARLVLDQDEDELIDEIKKSTVKLTQRISNDIQGTVIPANECIVESAKNSLTCIWNSPSAVHTVWNVENVLRSLSLRNNAINIQYIHGNNEAMQLAKKLNGVAILLPPISRSHLFSAVKHFGNLPKKSFSLGRAKEKRYYFEARSLQKKAF